MPPGRKCALDTDPDLLGRIVAFVKNGAHPERAAVACGVAERTHYLWQAKGLEERDHREAGKAPRKTWETYLDYADKVEQAVALAEMELLTKATGGGADSTPALKVMERRFRDRWSAKDPSTGPAPAPVAAPPVGTPLDEFTRRREQRSGKKTRQS